jgi:hypothetical protein
MALDTRFPAGMTTCMYNDMPITYENLKAVIQKEYRRYGRFARTNPAPSDFLDEGVSRIDRGPMIESRSKLPFGHYQKNRSTNAS